MAISDWPLAEQPRQKLLQQGAETLSDSELLAIILRIGRRGQSALDLARELLTYAGSLRRLLHGEARELLDIPGIGPSKYVQLQALAEIARRYFAESAADKMTLTSSQAVKQFVLSRLRDYQYEVFSALFLDAQNGLIRYEELFQGCLDQTPVFPRQVAKKALLYNAKAIILAHNHPSGDPSPSQADRVVTKHLVNALGLFEIAVYDHLIIGDNTVCSFAECGLLG